MTGCAVEGPPPSGSQDPLVVAAREQIAKDQSKILTAAALQEPLSISVDDGCIRGQHSAPWGPFDGYYWQCRYATSWVVSSELVDPALLIEAYRTHLSTVDCEPDVAAFDQVESYWQMYGTTGRLDTGETYTVDSLPPATAQCPDGARIAVTFGSSAAYEPPELIGIAEYEGEQVDVRPHDLDAIRGSGSPLVVTLSMWGIYHEVSR